MSTASDLPLFSAAHGHTYLRPVQKSLGQPESQVAQQSKEDTPLPAAQAPSDEPSKSTGTIDDSARSLFAALNMSMRYGKEYMDDMPLVGEPGKFRFARGKDPSHAGQLNNQVKQTTSTNANTPAQSRAGSPLAPTQPESAQRAPLEQARERNPHSPPDVMKSKRRKSKAANPSP